MPNLALISVPVYYILCLAPHAYAVSLVSSYSKWNNVNPRSPDYNATLQKQLPAAVYGKFERAESAHKNSIENLPLFIAAIAAGLMAEKVAGQHVGTSTYAAVWLAMRAAYTLLYINTTSQGASRARSLTFVATIALTFYQIYKAAVALA